MKNKTKIQLIVVMVGLLLFTSGTSWNRSMGMAANGVVTPLLQYQGRLTDPATGEIAADGSYSMSIQLYNVETGGTALWTETESVTVQNGIFSTVLGDTTTLISSLFNGQALWLGVTVEGEELGPRQQVLPVAYALSLVPGAVVEANSAPVLEVNHSGGGEALQVGGNLNVSGSLIGGSHTHTSAGIVDGTISTSDLANNAVTTSKIANSSVTSDDIQDRTQTITFPANALNFEPGTTIQHYGIGLRWQYDYQQGATLIISRPEDWDGTSDVEMHIYFLASTNTSGYVQFFIRPRAFNPGDNWTDVSDISDDPVYVSKILVVHDQVINIPASRFGTDVLWVISMQREGAQSTYPDDVYLMSISLSYNAVR